MAALSSVLDFGANLFARVRVRVRVRVGVRVMVGSGPVLQSP